MSSPQQQHRDTLHAESQTTERNNTMNNNTETFEINNAIAREFVGARLVDVINVTATRMSLDPNTNSNTCSNIEIVRVLLKHSLHTISCIGEQPVTLTVSEWHADEIDIRVRQHIEKYTFVPWEMESDMWLMKDIACRLVNTENHVISIA